MKILCVEDDQSLAKQLEQILLEKDFQVDLAYDGQSGFDLAEVIPYDLILLDWGLPKLDGVHFCQKLRVDKFSNPPLNFDTPIMLMTARNTLTHKIIGLDAGADDYVVKPFRIEELLARIRALLRRKPVMHSGILTWGELTLNPVNGQVAYQGSEIHLKPKEYELLKLFLRNPNQIFSISRLLDWIWTFDDPPSDNAVRAQIKGLRQKLKGVGLWDIIETIYKLGYRLKPLEVNNQDDLTRQVASSEFNQELGKIENSDAQQKSYSSSVNSKIKQLWEKYRQSYIDRLKIIQETIAALEKGKLTPAQQEQAEREVHTMIGSLGSLGFHYPCRLSRKIQQILKLEQPLKQSQCQELKQLVRELQEHLESDSSPQILIEEENCLPTQTVNSHLLIIEDDLIFAQQIAKEVKLRDFQVHMASDLQQARQILKTQPVDLIILDLNFPQSAENGLDFLAESREQYQKIPVIILTAEESLSKRVKASRLGIQCFLQKPIAPAQVLTTITQVLEQAHQLVFRLLVVDDDPASLELIRGSLEPHGYQVILLDQPQNFWETLEQTLPDLLILDVELSPIYPFKDYSSDMNIEDLTGFDLCQVIRNDPHWNRLPVIISSIYNDPETIERSFLVGADDFLPKPIIPMELLNRVQIRLSQRKLWKLTEIDELTGVSLRHKTLQDLTRLLRLAKRQKQPLSLTLLDLDHFKKINDSYGHEMGDRVLSYLGQLLNQSFRQEDVIGRWGGEEFLIAMYDTTKEDGSIRLKVVLDKLSKYQFTVSEEKVFSVTFSGGIAQFPNDGEEIQSLYHAADVRLYQAKNKGRNCIVITE